MSRLSLVIGSLAVLGFGLPALGAVGKDHPGGDSSGALLFRVHCASCHGLDARGDGPVAEHLRVPPADLTDLLEEDDLGNKEFSAERIRLVIDGRDDVRGHGSREMPVWGPTFQEAGRDANQEDVVLEKIEDLVEHLRTIQQPDSVTEVREAGPAGDAD